jgi:ABC-type multidrug transport system fused ATPase/permease subunit
MQLGLNPTTYYLKINYEYGVKAKKSWRVDRLFSEQLLKNELSDHIKPLIIDIETEKYYDLINILRKLYEERLTERLHISGEKKKSLPVQQMIVNGLQAAVDSAPGKIDFLDQKVRKYLSDMKEVKLNGIYRVEKTSLGKILSLFCLLVLLFPVYLYGVVNNFIPLSLSIWARKKIKDPQFKSSFLYVVSLVAFPLLQTLQTVLVAFFVDHWYWVAAYFVSVPLSGIFLIYYHNLANKFQRALKIFKLFRKRKTFMDQLQNDYQEILNIVDSLLQIDQADLDRLSG